VRRIERLVRTAPTSRLSLTRLALAGLLHDAQHDLHRIVAPTLVLAGEHDYLLGTLAPRRLAACIPGAAFEIVAASGHDLTLEQPAFTAARFARFLALATPKAAPDEKA
jgi:3-oxoadipate enol-lactonase